MKKKNEYWINLIEQIGYRKILFYIIFILIIYSINHLQPIFLGKLFDNKNSSVFIVFLLLVSYFSRSILKLPSNLMLQNIRSSSQEILWNNVSNRKKDNSSVGEIQNLIGVSSLATRNIQSIFLHNIVPSFLGVLIYTFILFNQAKIIGATYLISYILFFIIMYSTGNDVNKEIDNCLNSTTEIKNYIIDFFYNIDYIYTTDSFYKENIIYRNLLNKEKKAYFKQQFNVDKYFIMQEILLLIITIFQSLIFYYITGGFTLSSFLIILYSLNNVKDIGGAFLQIKEYELKLEKSLEKLGFKQVSDKYNYPNYNYGSQELLTISNLTVGISDKILIDNLSINVKEKEKIAIIGNNGSGKSTLLRTISGIIPFKKGSIIYNVEKSKMFYIPQHSRLFNRPIIENIVFPSMIESVEKSDVKFIMKLIKRIGLESLIKDEIDLFEKKPNDFGDKFSGGESQKILILRVLYNKPKIVLFDEITSNLDKKTKEIFYGMFDKEFRDITILSIIHDYSELKYYDKIVEL